MRRHQPLGGGAHLEDCLGGRHIFGQVEIVNARAMGRFCHIHIQMVGQAGQDGLYPTEFGGHCFLRGQVGVFDRKGKSFPRGMNIVAGHIETGLVEQYRRQLSDLAKPQYSDVFE